MGKHTFREHKCEVLDCNHMALVTDQSMYFLSWHCRCWPLVVKKWHPDAAYRNRERCRKRETDMLVVLALPTIMTVMDRVVCVLLHKAKAIINKFSKFQTEKSNWDFILDLTLKIRELHMPISKHLSSDLISTLQQICSTWNITGNHLLKPISILLSRCWTSSSD
jgi:hypothetical protein